jgi:hypothetical protein
VSGDRLRLVDRLAWLAALLVTVAALAGLLVPGLYRDSPVLVDATRVDNGFQLLVALPVLVAALLAARRGSVLAGLAVIGSLMYLAYFFGLYALAGVVNAMTLVHISITGLACWAIVLGLPAIEASNAEAHAGPRLYRRTMAVFLLAVAGFHIPLWASQVLGSAASGTLPAALVEFGWLNTPVYLFDLAFAMPLGIVAAVFLLRHDPRGSLLAVPFAWFSLLLALDMFAEQAWLVVAGKSADPGQAMPFALIALVSALVLLPLGLRGRAVVTRPVPAGPTA